MLLCTPTDQHVLGKCIWHILRLLAGILFNIDSFLDSKLCIDNILETILVLMACLP